MLQCNLLTYTFIISIIQDLAYYVKAIANIIHSASMKGLGEKASTCQGRKY